MPPCRAGTLFAGGDSERFGQTPCMVQGGVGPRERVETGARCRRRHALQGHVFQYPVAAGLAFGTELFRRIFEGLEHGRSGLRLRLFRGVDPRCQCLDARFEAWRRLPVAGDWRDAPEIVVELTASALGLLAIEQQMEEIVIIPARGFALAFDSALDGLVLP